jgi:hypothetical protein
MLYKIYVVESSWGKKEVRKRSCSTTIDRFKVVKIELLRWRSVRRRIMHGFASPASRRVARWTVSFDPIPAALLSQH